MKLTSNEKREIIKLIEADQPLPDKYRFLLFDNKREVELVWNGKTHEVCNIVLPFQVIERVDQPYAEKPEDTNTQPQHSFCDERDRRKASWTNQLIWGDNKLILSSLNHGPFREEIEKNGGIKLIYIDPPFDVGADFSMDIAIGEDTRPKKPKLLEKLAYRDTWGKGTDSFMAMIYERLVLMRDLLAEDGSIYIHCDWRVNSLLRIVLEEIFGKENFLNEILWRRRTNTVKAISRKFSTNTDTIFLFTKKTDRYLFNIQYGDYPEEYLERFKYEDENGKYRWQVMATYSVERYEQLKKENRLRESSNAKYPEFKQYLRELKGRPIDNIWDDINMINAMGDERLGYDTQKPEALLERIIKASSNENDLIADFFCGSGTTLAAAEKLGRKWIGSDLGKFAIHTTRKRMIGVQRQLKAAGKNFRAFEILNLGKYERMYNIGVDLNLGEAEKQKQLEQKEKKFVYHILRVYQAETVENFTSFCGQKAGRVITVGPINMPVTRRYVEEIILECREKGFSRVDILAFEFEMGLFPNIQEEAKATGIDLALKYIPHEIFDKQAVEKNQVVFHDVSYIEIKPLVKKKAIAVQLTDFSVYYSQDTVDNATAGLKEGAHKIVVEGGRIIKVFKDKDGIITQEILTKKWTDWIDYWSVDFDFENKREMVRLKNEVTGVIEEAWTGNFIFKNEWQSFRTKKDRSLELTTPYHQCKPGCYKIAVKIVDIFGNDTMKIIDVNVEVK